MIRILILLLISCTSSAQLYFGRNINAPATPDTGFNGTIFQLEWDTIYKERNLSLIDEDFIHYQSDYSTATGLTTISGNAATLSGGDLSVTGDSKYRTSTAPFASWWSVQIDISSMGASGSLGGGIIKDASNYIIAIYNKDINSARIYVNGSLKGGKDCILNTTNLILTLQCTQNQLTFWAKEDGEDSVLIGTALNDVTDMCADGALDDYYYGIVSNGSHLVNALRAGGSGGTGYLNVRTATNEDGSPYYENGKLYIVADRTSLGNSNPAAQNFTIANSCVYSLDTATHEIRTVGRFFFHRDDTLHIGQFRTLGGQAIKLMWRPSIGKWMITYTFSDWEYADLTDQYALIDSINGEQIIEKAQLIRFGLPPGTNKIFDCNPKKIGAYWYLTGVDAGVPEGNATFSGALPSLFKGASLDDMDLVAIGDHPGNSFEMGNFPRYKSVNYVIFSAPGNTREFVYDLDMNFLGLLNLPYDSTTEIPGYDWFSSYSAGRSRYYLIGYDTENFSTVDVVGDTITAPWSRSNLVIWRSRQTVAGSEY